MISWPGCEAATSADLWKLPKREVVKLCNFAPKVANAFLLALRSSLQLCGRGAALCLEGNLDQPTISSLETGQVLEKPNLAEHPPTRGELKEVCGRRTRLPVDWQKVVVARREEMHLMARLGVTGHDPVPTRWIDINKGDEGTHDWNARFAETPPLEVFRLQMSMVMSVPKPELEDDELVGEFLDVCRAHFHAPIDRKVFACIDGDICKLGRTVWVT